MDNYKKDFLELAIQKSALRFGEFTLKSGRVSPYFFQAGVFNHGASLAKIGSFFAHAIMGENIKFDGLFGPAYKGIPLVSATAIALSEKYNLNKPWAFNRKTVKSYGEGGLMIGAQMTGKMLIVDDVLTAGTAVGEAVDLIHVHGEGATVCGVVTLLDRCEIVEKNESAKTLVSKKHNLSAFSVVTIYDVIEFLRDKNRLEEMNLIKKHLKTYGEKL